MRYSITLLMSIPSIRRSRSQEKKMGPEQRASINLHPHLRQLCFAKIHWVIKVLILSSDGGTVIAAC